MAENESGVKILITGDATGAMRAADAAAQGLGALIGNTARLGAETGKATAAGEEQEKYLETSRLIFSQLNRVVPEFETLLGAAFEGPLGAVVALAVALGEVKKRLDECNAELDKASAAQDKLNLEAHAESLNRLTGAWDNATEANAKYFAAVDSGGSKEDPTDKQIKDAQAVTDAEEDAAKKIIGALGKVKVARLKASGASSDDIVTAEGSTQTQIADIDRQKQAQVVADKQDELTRRKSNQPRLDQAAVAAHADASEKERRAQTIQEKLEADRKAAQPGGEISTHVEAAAAALAAAQSMPENVNAPGGMGETIPSAAREAALKKAQDDLDTANQTLARREAEIKTLGKQKAQADYDAAIAAEKAEKATKAGIANSDRVAELPGEITQTQAVQQAALPGQIATQAAAQIALDQHTRTLDQSAAALRDSIVLQRQAVATLAQIPASQTALHGEFLKIVSDLRDSINAVRQQVVNLQSTGIQ
jgi:hypothetical protein